MPGSELIATLGLMIVFAAGMCLVLRPLRIPSLVAYLVTGLLLGPILGWVERDAVLGLMAELGTSLLLFLVGMELSLARLRDVGKVAVVAGVGQVLFTTAGGLALTLLLGFSLVEGAVLATALTFSSTVVVVKLLDQKEELNELYGRIAVGIFLVQDLIAVSALTLLGGLSQAEASGGLEIALGIGRALLGAALLLLAALGLSRWVLGHAFRWAGRWPPLLLVWSLSWCMVFIAGAELLGVSIEVGAFVAGLSLAQLPHSAELRRRVHPLMDFFVVVFFVVLGTDLDLNAALDRGGTAAALTLFVLLGNPFIFMVLITRMGYGERTAFLCSVTVAQISEFSFVFVAVAAASGLVSTEVVSVVALVGLVTFAASTYMIVYNHQLYGWAARAGLLAAFRAAPESPEPAPPLLAGHVVVVGMNVLGRAIVTRLAREGHEVVAVDSDLEKLADLPAQIVVGDANHPKTLEEACLERARLLVSAVQIEDTSRLLVHRCRELGVRCSVHAFDPNQIADLRALGADHLLEPKQAAAREQLQELARLGLLAP